MKTSFPLTETPNPGTSDGSGVGSAISGMMEEDSPKEGEGEGTGDTSFPSKRAFKTEERDKTMTLWAGIFSPSTQNHMSAYKSEPIIVAKEDKVG